MKSLDIGYGYTADGGRTFPLRGKGVGAMPTLREVLERFPERRFLLDHKSGKSETLVYLARVLESVPIEQRARLYYWGPLGEMAHDRIPGLGGVLHPRSALKECGISYLLSFGIGPLAQACRGADILVPTRATPILWGWPRRFIRKADHAGSRVFLWTDDLDAAANAGVDGVMTDQIETVGPAFRQQR